MTKELVARIDQPLELKASDGHCPGGKDPKHHARGESGRYPLWGYSRYREPDAIQSRRRASKPRAFNPEPVAFTE